jgi:hypothetical protein
MVTGPSPECAATTRLRRFWSFGRPYRLDPVARSFAISGHTFIPGQRRPPWIHRLPRPPRLFLPNETRGDRNITEITSRYCCEFSPLPLAVSPSGQQTQQPDHGTRHVLLLALERRNDCPTILLDRSVCTRDPGRGLAATSSWAKQAIFGGSNIGGLKCQINTSFMALCIVLTRILQGAPADRRHWPIPVRE